MFVKCFILVLTILNSVSACESMKCCKKQSTVTMTIITILPTMTRPIDILPMPTDTATMTTDTMPIETMPTMTTGTMTTTTLIPTGTPSPNTTIPKTEGVGATLTYFTDNTTQCFGSNIPSGNGAAVNPLLLGFTIEDWTSKYSSANPADIPWCGKTITVKVKGKTFEATIIDTCSITDNPFPDPITGDPIGGKCGYENVIDLYGQPGLQFLQSVAGDDFYQGNDIEWSIK